MKMFNKLCVSILSAVFLFTALALPAKACTGVIVGSDLTEDGTTIFGRTEDLEINHNKVYKINEAGKYKKGEILLLNMVCLMKQVTMKKVLWLI